MTFDREQYVHWWLPRWLDRALPNVDVEGEKLAHHLDDAPAAEPALR